MLSFPALATTSARQQPHSSTAQEGHASATEVTLSVIQYIWGGRLAFINM